MKGQRIPDGEWHTNWPHPPGSYGRVWDTGEEDWSWWCVTPNGHAGNLTTHDVTLHDDDTITVSPSIVVETPGSDHDWHGYLERGVWREA